MVVVSKWAREHWTAGLFIGPRWEDDRVCWCWPKLIVDEDALIVIHRTEDRSRIEP